jgi:hypothetical protein
MSELHMVADLLGEWRRKGGERATETRDGGHVGGAETEGEHRTVDGDLEVAIRVIFPVAAVVVLLEIDAQRGGGAEVLAEAVEDQGRVGGGFRPRGILKGE